MNSIENKGIIGKAFEEGHPVIYSFSKELPPKEIILNNKYLTVISWKYEGNNNNGMPESSENNEMIKFEDILEECIIEKGYCHRAYSRTGNNLKEFVLYIESRDTFLNIFNAAYKNLPKFPIQIKFYEDPEWSDLKALINDF